MAIKLTPLPPEPEPEPVSVPLTYVTRLELETRIKQLEEEVRSLRTQLEASGIPRRRM